MSRYRADLHCHSTCSDGTYTPEKLLEHAVAVGLKGISITDHDTLEAYKTATQVAKSLGIDLIPGVELSAFHKGTSVHILGYAFFEGSRILHDFCKRHYLRRCERNANILELLGKHSVLLDEKDIFDECQGTPGRPHIALAMVRKGYVRTIQEAFDKYIGDRKPCYSPGEQFSVEETLEVIHNAGGLAVIAHPDKIKSQKVVREILSMKFDGIEGYYSMMRPQREKKWIDIGRQKGWLITGGSDFHGDVKPHIPLGCSWVDEEAFQVLKIQYSNHR